MVLVVAAVFVLVSANPEPEMTTIEAGLYSQKADTVAIIVTATDVKIAARAVKSLGGQVTAEMGESGSLAATLPAVQLDALAIQDGIYSIESGSAFSAQGANTDGYN
jgi:hypothetical protein